MQINPGCLYTTPPEKIALRQFLCKTEPFELELVLEAVDGRRDKTKRTKTLLSNLLLILAVLIITGSFVSASDIAVLFQAVKSGDIAEVKRLIEAGAKE